MSSDVLHRLRQIIEAEPRIHTVGPPIALEVDSQGGVTLDGEVTSVAAKRLALHRIACLPDVLEVVDRLRVAPKQRFSDEQIRRCLFDFLLDEPMFSAYEFVSSARALKSKRPAPSSKLRIEFGVEDGIVMLRGRAASRLDQRLAGVLAWWAPGSRDVVNLLAIDSSTQDGDDEIAVAVRTALQKDPLIARAPQVSVRESVVTLTGTVADSEERDAAEADAWYILGVRDVVNATELDA